jgi:SNF2 family DNA or RNA helicase
MSTNEDIIYGLEITSESPRCAQPEKIKKLLKPHQLACLYKATLMENIGTVNYNIVRNDDFSSEESYMENIKVSTNIGILGDIVGYGKTLTALAIVAHNPTDNIHKNNLKTYSFYSSRAYNYLTAVCEVKKAPDMRKMLNSTLIIVPKGPVYVQWEKTMKESTTLKYLAIDSLLFIKKNLPEFKNDNEDEIINYFNQYDVVLIKNTTLCKLIDAYNKTHIENFINRWKRVIIDECHDIINKVNIFGYLYIWLISGTYENMCRGISASSYTQYGNIKDVLKVHHMKYFLVKCNRDFVKESFSVPPIIEKYYLCKMSQYLKAIKNYISNNVLERINANDISGAIRELGGKNETEEGIVKLICEDMNKSIFNKQKEREYVSGLDIPDDVKENKLKVIDGDLAILEGKLKDLTERISEIDKKTCPICLDNIIHPIILDCTHIFCGACLINLFQHESLRNQVKKCPECRAEIKSTDKLTAIVPKKSEEDMSSSQYAENEGKYSLVGNGSLSKEDTLIEIIKNNSEGKFIVFSRVDAFTKIMDLLRANNLTYDSLKGHTGHMMKVLENFRSGKTNVILLTTQYAGSGIEISCATDVVILHSMAVDKQQAIGRAQRVGRTCSLNVHNLCYEHEMEGR